MVMCSNIKDGLLRKFKLYGWHSLDIWLTLDYELPILVYISSGRKKPICSLMGGKGGGGGGRKVPAAHNSKTIHGMEMKIAEVVENHKLNNSV